MPVSLAEQQSAPPGADPEPLARYITTVANGIAVQAVGGATRSVPQQVVAREPDAALRNWPPV